MLEKASQHNVMLSPPSFWTSLLFIQPQLINHTLSETLIGARFLSLRHTSKIAVLSFKRH